MSHLKFLKKYLQSQNFEKNGYVYKFDNVTDLKDFADSYKFHVTASLPKKGQSYSAEKMSHDLNEIIQNIFTFLGENFSYSISLTLDTEVEGDESPEIYVTPEKQQKILEKLNKDFSVFYYKSKEIGGELFFKLYFFNPEIFEQKMFPDEKIEEEVRSVIFYKVTDIKLVSDGKIIDVQANPKKVDDIAGVLSLKIHESDTSSRIENIMYDVLEDEIQIGEYEIYYAANLYCKFINGMKVNSANWELNEFQKDMFIY